MENYDRLWIIQYAYTDPDTGEGIGQILTEADSEEEAIARYKKYADYKNELLNPSFTRIRGKCYAAYPAKTFIIPDYIAE